MVLPDWPRNVEILRASGGLRHADPRKPAIALGPAGVSRRTADRAARAAGIAAFK